VISLHRQSSPVSAFLLAALTVPSNYIAEVHHAAIIDICELAIRLDH
jgi:hypothetical protein